MRISRKSYMGAVLWGGTLGLIEVRAWGQMMGSGHQGGYNSFHHADGVRFAGSLMFHS